MNKAIGKVSVPFEMLEKAFDEDVNVTNVFVNCKRRTIDIVVESAEPIDGLTLHRAPTSEIPRLKALYPSSDRIDIVEGASKESGDKNSSE